MIQIKKYIYYIEADILII